MKIGLLVGCSLVLSILVYGDEKYQPIAPFLNQYCVECHGPEKFEAEVRLDDMNAIDPDLWIDIYDQLEFGDMPPRKASQPPEGKKAEILELIDAISRDESYTIATGFRRMNKREYRNTVRDLLGLSDEFFDPSASIFEDEVEEGFDTNSESLTISNELLLEYLRAATISLNTAMYAKDASKPESKETTFNAKQLVVDGQLSGRRDGMVIQRQKKGGIYPKTYSSVIPATGNYRITVTAAGLDRNPQQPGKGVPFRMNLLASFAGTTKRFHRFDIRDDVLSEYSAVVWLEKGAKPYVQGDNIHSKPRNINRRRPEGKQLTIPAFAVGSFTIEGPIDVEWPPKTYKTIFQTNVMPNLEDEQTRQQVLRNFISRAFRRQVHPSEQARFSMYLQEQREKRGNWHDAFIRTFAAIMASTDFLYIKEEVGQLDSFQLANRLSYFLWSSMPDLELFRLANAGQLLDPEVFKGQVRRMINDPKAASFVEGFAMQWLSLDELGSMRPSEDDRAYRIYYSQNIEEAMRDETMYYFKYILGQNRPITEFLDSDYTFLNKGLAQLYGIPFEGGHDMRLVQLPENSVRGGLLGHGSIHAITSNGVETLPVDRGHWVLNELMGTPPPPPPEEVPALVPDLTGAITQREQLKRHSEDPKCYGCHRVMDPPGLALESFDIIGRHRTSYGKNSRIITSGEFMGGEFEDVRGLRAILMEHKDTFTYNLIVKVAEYAKGRKLNRADHDVVELIAAQAKERDYRFLHILGDIMMSDLMLNR